MNSWAHIDIAGVMESHGELPYLDKGMSGIIMCVSHTLCVVRVVLDKNTQQLYSPHADMFNSQLLLQM